MKTFRIKIVVDTTVEAETYEDAVNDFCDSLDLWGEVDCEEIED